MTLLLLAAARSEASPALTILFGVVFLLIGIGFISISRLPNDRNPDLERWPYSGSRLIGAWVFIIVGPAIVLLGLARLLW